MSDRIERTVEVSAPVERVWRALTDHHEFGRWFRVDLDGPFTVGGTTTGRMTYPGYEGVTWEAVVETMEAPRLFAFRWPHPADPFEDEPAAPTTLVEFRLSPIPGGTLLTIVESGFEALPMDRRAEAMRGNEGGWKEQAGNIKAHVEGSRAHS